MSEKFSNSLENTNIVPDKVRDVRKIDEESPEVRNLYTMLRSGLPCSILAEGFCTRSLLQLRTVEKSIWVFWRSQPTSVGAELFFVSLDQPPTY